MPFLTEGSPKINHTKNVPGFSFLLEDLDFRILVPNPEMLGFESGGPYKSK